MAKNISINIQNLLRQRELGENVEHFRVKLFNKRLTVAKNLYKNDISQHFGCVNAIEFSKEGNFLTSGGDDRRVLLFRVDQVLVNPKEAKSTAMQKHHESNIFALAFDNSNTKIFSGGNDDATIVHQIET